MMILTFLLLAHVVADFYLQPHTWIMCKVANKIKSLGLVKHLGMHLVITAIALYLGTVTSSVNIELYDLVIALVIIILSHYAIDLWKTYMGFTTVYFLLDQLGHLLVILGISLWLSGMDITSILTFISTHITSAHVGLILGYLLAYKPLSILIQLLLRPYLNQLDNNDQTNSGLQAAGEYIGGLERFLVITFVLLGQFGGIGFLLAAKSVFRFGDMRRQRDRKLTEYIMLGTLLSFTFALLIGLLIKSLLSMY